MDKALEERVLCQDGPITVIAVMMADHHTTADDRDYDTPEHERDYRARFEACEFDYVRMVVRVEFDGVCVHTAMVCGIEHGTVAENVEADAWELTPYRRLSDGVFQMGCPLHEVLTEALWAAQDWLEHSGAYTAALTTTLAWADPVGAEEPTTYTVVGVLSDQGRLSVAGVIEGPALLADTDSGDTDRWAGSFDAADAADAKTIS